MSRFDGLGRIEHCLIVPGALHTDGRNSLKEEKELSQQKGTSDGSGKKNEKKLPSCIYMVLCCTLQMIPCRCVQSSSVGRHGAIYAAANY